MSLYEALYECLAYLTYTRLREPSRPDSFPDELPHALSYPSSEKMFATQHFSQPRLFCGKLNSRSQELLQVSDIQSKSATG